jgi:hypothetical protein
MRTAKKTSSRSTNRTSPRGKKLLNYAVPALEKGLDVLELLARQSEGLTKNQLARELNRTVSEIFRMLVCLERRGYIPALGEERYSLTLRLFQLVQQHPPTERLIVVHARALTVLALCQRSRRNSVVSSNQERHEQGMLSDPAMGPLENSRAIPVRDRAQVGRTEREASA